MLLTCSWQSLHGVTAMGEVTYILRIIILTTIFAAVLPATSFADTIHVPGDFEVIQDAVDAAVDGDTVHIAAGTYQFEGAERGADGGTASIVAKLITLSGETNTDGSPAVTFEGVQGPSGAVPRGLVVAGTIGSIHVENIRVTNCYGGLLLYKCGLGVTISNCIFEGNFVGGAMQDAQATLTNCVFRDNEAIIGGIQIDAYSNGYTDITFIDCVIENNRAIFSSYSGIGGMLVSDSTVTMQGCTVRNNFASSPNGDAIGGLLIKISANVSLTDTTLCGNIGDDTPGPQIVGDYTDNGGNTIEDECPVDCVEDINGDGTVSVSDLLQLIGAWGPCGGCDEDIDDSGEVNVSDLLTVIAAWGDCE